jgi:anthranilate synthase
MHITRYQTRGNIAIRREVSPCSYQHADTALIESLNSRRGLFPSSSFEFPGRYTRWNIGFVVTRRWRLLSAGRGAFAWKR